MPSHFAPNSLRRYSLHKQFRSHLLSLAAKALICFIIVCLAVLIVLSPPVIRLLSQWWGITGIQLAIITGLIGFGATALFALIMIGCATGSYLEVSSEGLIFRCWPFYHVRCQWNEVEKLLWAGDGRKDDMLLLKRADLLSPSLLWPVYRALWPMSGRQSIPLSILDGWPDGELLEDLSWYAPHLLKQPPKPPRS